MRTSTIYKVLIQDATIATLLHIKRKVFFAIQQLEDNRMHKIVVCLVFVLFMRIYSETTINYKVLFIFDAFRSNLEPLFLPFKSNFSFCSLNIYLRAQTMGCVTSKNRLRDPSFLFFIARWLRDLCSFLRTLSSDCVVVCVHESYTVKTLSSYT